jgi:photosystem II stability/assembly factor-like uncharacterized protein
MTPEMRDDAQLNDLFFLNPDQGWAVGDRGVILHTEDGGRHWQLQRAPTAGCLESVHFIDTRHGWAVGSVVHPYTHRTRCIVARTQDGGRTWMLVPDLTLPGLKQVHFHTQHHGWAIGNGSSLYPTGVFRTDDGGRSWATIPGGLSGKWTAGDFFDPHHGVVAGHDGRLATIAVPRVVDSRTPDLGKRPLRAIQVPDGRTGWMVGDGGLAMQTSDGGLTWQNPEGRLPAGAKDLFDFRALAVLGPHVWIAGAPGTTIFHTADGGHSWELLPTDQQVPLRAITFVDPDRGWAVGALGTILATRDGGHTWRRQRVGGTRLALLGIFSEAERVPLELFALQSGDEGYLGFAEILSRRDIELPAQDEAPLEDKVRAALSAVGACGAEQAWRFPLRQKGLQLGSQELIRIWDRANDGRGVALLEELLVRRIRQWRPEVVVTEASGSRGDRPLSQLTTSLVLSAVVNAADPTAFPEHAMSGGLRPWSVKKVFCVAEESDEATVRLTTSQLATRLGRSVAEHAEDGYSLIQAEHSSIPVTVGFRLLQDRLPQSAGRTDIFSGIFLQPGGEARRRSSAPAMTNLESLTRAAQKRRNIDQLFQLGSNTASGVWLGQLQDLTKTLPPHSAGQVLFQLGQRYRRAGQVELAAQTLEQLVERYPHHGLTETALLWLVQYYASGEAAWQLRRATRFDSRLVGSNVSKTETATGVRAADYEAAADRSRSNAPFPLATRPGLAAPHTKNGGEPPQVHGIRSQVQSAGHTTTAGAQFDVSDRAGLAVKYARMIQQGRPTLFAEPQVQFPAAVAYRAQGMNRDAERFFHRLGSAPVPSDWERCAQSELWLLHGRGKSPKTAYRCRRGAARPHLDGQLDDPIWQGAEQLELSSPQHDDARWPAAGMVTHDGQFLYLAVSCRKAPGRSYASTPGPRPRDPPLGDRDRVDLYVDLDRDYTSYYRLTVDHRGWTGEACFGNVQWNPTWYVAQHSTDEEWTVEAAIPLSELVPTAPSQNDVWAIGLQRVVPGVGIQAISQPASVDPRGESFALLLFE